LAVSAGAAASAIGPFGARDGVWRL